MTDSPRERVAVYPMADGSRRLLVRGAVEVRVEPSGEVVRGDGGPGWFERSLAPHEAIVVLAAAPVPAPIPAVPAFAAAPSRPEPLPAIPVPPEPLAPLGVPPVLEPSSGFDDSLDSDDSLRPLGSTSMRAARPRFLEDSRSVGAPMLSTPGGQSILLDRSVIIGRAPRVTEGSRFAAAPRLVTILGERRDVSRSHVRVDVEGGRVVLTDLASRNGTSVTLPGCAPVRLRSGEPASVTTGTVIDLGGGVRFTVGRRR